MIKDKKFSITIGEAITFITFIISMVSGYFAIDKRISILENECINIKDNQKLWIKQISNSRKIWNESKFKNDRN